MSRERAAELLDFGGRVDAKGVSPQLIEDQLDGAVAAHNLLQSTGVAYVADEVGTGKTLVAAGALALLRHREPGMKAMIVAPRANLQQKWRRELETFARSNVRYADLRVRGLGGEAVRRPLTAPRLSAAVSLWHEAPDADLITRLSSFQLGHPSDRAEDRRRYVESWHHVLGAAGSRSVRALLDDAARRTGDHVKVAIAACVNRLLPDIGVLVVDEAHNLKGGVARGAARNRVLWTMLGHNEDFAGRLPGYGPRVERVLMLSATPMEDDTDQLLNQLVVLGIADRVPGLQAADEGERLAALHTFLFRRLTKMRVGDQVLTRNRYRQEWRQGGTVDVEQPLPLEDLRDRLTFAVVQKKVAEALNNGGGGAQFQIGMLTSFGAMIRTCGWCLGEVA